MRSIFTLILLLICLAGSTSVAGEVRVITNTVTADLTRETIRLTPAWTLGADDDEIFFGEVTHLTTDNQGNLLVTDLQQAQVEVFAPDGNHLRSLTREGEGPGEVRAPYASCVLPDGAVAMPERFVGKIVVVEGDGKPRDSRMMQGIYTSINTIQCRGDHLLIAGQWREPTATGQIQHYVLARHDPDWTRRCIYVERTNELTFDPLVIDEGASFCARQRLCALGPDGRVYAVAGRNDYRITVYNPDGPIERIIERDYQPLARSDEEKARIRAQLEDAVRNVDLRKEFIVEPVEPAIDYVHVDRTGRLWVQHARSWCDQPAGVLLEFDVFDPDGQLVRQVVLKGPGNARDDVVWLLPDGRVAVVIGGVGGERALTDNTGLDRPLQVMMLNPQPS